MVDLESCSMCCSDFPAEYAGSCTDCGAVLCDGCRCGCSPMERELKLRLRDVRDYVVKNAGCGISDFAVKQVLRRCQGQNREFGKSQQKEKS